MYNDLQAVVTDKANMEESAGKVDEAMQRILRHYNPLEERAIGDKVRDQMLKAMKLQVRHEQAS